MLWIIYGSYNLHGAWCVHACVYVCMSIVYIWIDRKCHFQQKQVQTLCFFFFLCFCVLGKSCGSNVINISLRLEIDLSEKPHNSFSALCVYIIHIISFCKLTLASIVRYIRHLRHSIQNSCLVYIRLDFETIKTICCYLIRPKSCVWVCVTFIL